MERESVLGRDLREVREKVCEVILRVLCIYLGDTGRFWWLMGKWGRED